jgi:hypothetical protein
MEPITIESLASVAGATVVAGIVVQFVGIFAALSAAGKRMLSAVTGVVSLVGATVLLAPAVDAGLVILALINGMIAGFAASKLYEVATAGIDAKVTPTP